MSHPNFGSEIDRIESSKAFHIMGAIFPLFIAGAYLFFILPQMTQTINDPAIMKAYADAGVSTGYTKFSSIVAYLVPVFCIGASAFGFLQMNNHVVLYENGFVYEKLFGRMESAYKDVSDIHWTVTTTRLMNIIPIPIWRSHTLTILTKNSTYAILQSTYLSKLKEKGLLLASKSGITFKDDDSSS